jgi:hypothetical protein
MMLGMIVAVGSLAASGARAQENAAGTAATETPAQQDDAARNPQGETAKADPAKYGEYVPGPATVDADGVPVAKPNPMSDFLDRSRAFGDMPIEMPLVDDPRTDDSATEAETK